MKKDSARMGFWGVLLMIAAGLIYLVGGNIALLSLGQTLAICGAIFIAAQWRPRDRNLPLSEGSTQKCPDCLRDMPAGATICRHCDNAKSNAVILKMVLLIAIIVTGVVLYQYSH